MLESSAAPYPPPPPPPQLSNYRAFAQMRAASLGQSMDELMGEHLPGLESDEEARRWVGGWWWW